MISEFFNQNYGLILTAVSILIALLSLFLSPYISDHFNAKNQTKSMQEKWMDYLRSTVSEYIVNCEQFRYKRKKYMEFCSSGKNISMNYENGAGDILQDQKLREQEDIYPRIISLQRKLKLLFKKESKDWPSVKSYIDRMWEIANKGGENASEYSEVEKQLVQKVEDILEEEWKKITSPSKLNKYYKPIVILLLGYISIMGTLIFFSMKTAMGNGIKNVNSDTVYVQTFDPLYLKEMDSISNDIVIVNSLLDSLFMDYRLFKKNIGQMITQIRNEKATGLIEPR